MKITYMNNDTTESWNNEKKARKVKQKKIIVNIWKKQIEGRLSWNIIMVTDRRRRKIDAWEDLIYKLMAIDKK